MAESPPALPAFTPVPVRARSDGWTPARQIGFIEALAETRSPTRAARAVGMTREGAYALRRRPGAESFAAAWEALLARPPARTGLTLYERAITGVAVPYFYGGLQRAEHRHYDDAALLRLLRSTTRAARGRGCG